MEIGSINSKNTILATYASAIIFLHPAEFNEKKANMGFQDYTRFLGYVLKHIMLVVSMRDEIYTQFFGFGLQRCDPGYTALPSY